MKRPYLSVIIPCYNEEKNLRQGVLDEVNQYLEIQDYSSEIIIADDGSTDKSLKLIEKYISSHRQFKLLKNPHAGKPFALRAGLMRAQGKIVLLTDMDQSAPISEIEKLLPWFKKGFKVVIGSRGQGRKGFSLFRQLASIIFRIIRQQLLLKGIVDTQCGFKAFRCQSGRNIFSQMQIFKQTKKAKGWKVGAWDVEMLFVAQKMGYKIKEVFVDWQDRDVATTKGRQKKFIKESKEMLIEILRVKLNDLKGLYG